MKHKIKIGRIINSAFLVFALLMGAINAKTPVYPLMDKTNDKLVFAPAACPGAGLLISEIYTNPSGNDSPFEFVELRATRTINFATTPHSIVFVDNGSANANGWIKGGGTTYGFNITTGTVNAGDVVYVGGSSMIATGQRLRQISTGTTNGDGFGNANSGGVLGNGGANADAIGVFSVAVGGITNSTVPVDAVFFGTGIGNAFFTTTSGYQLPVNDLYPGGKVQTNSFVAPDPAANEFIVASGTFSTATCDFSTPRTFIKSTIFSDGVSSVSLAAANAPTINENTASPFINLPANGAGFLSGAIGDPTDPGKTAGIDFTLADPDTPAANLTVTATSSNQTVVPNGNLVFTGSGANRNLKITPAGAGFAVISVTVSDGTSTTNYVVYYAASAASATAAATVFHTGKSDASTAIAVDANYMFVADDENQGIRLYDRKNSGLPTATFDFTANLGLTDINGGVPREVDIEASAQNGNRIYWLGSHSNAAAGESRPNRSRLFATDISGSGVNSILSYVGRYDNLKTDLINWDTNNLHGLGANYFGLAASAAVGVIPEAANGSGFNIEGMVFAPDNSTGYVAFRAPIVPAANRTKALIVPVTNIAALVTGNPTAGAAAFGAPIQLDLGGLGIREIKKNAANEYLIIAGSSSDAGIFRIYAWTGNQADAPVQRTADLSGLNPEGIVEVPNGLNNFAPSAAVSVQFVSDNGDTVYYGNGVAAKDLANDEFKKFRSDFRVVGLAPTAAGVSIGGRVMTGQYGLMNAAVYLTDSNGETRTAHTSLGGNFRFDDVAAGETYTIIVVSRRYLFQPQVVPVFQDLTGLTFYAEP